MRSATELSRLLQSGELRAAEVARDCLERIERHDAQVGAFLRVDAERVLDEARRIDRRREAGEPLGPLAGLPVAVKDNLVTRGAPTTCGSRMLAEFISPYDATVVTRLRQADAVLVGKTALDEFAMGSSTQTSALGTTGNPWDLERTPGGSSGGSAACVAASMAPLAIGSDTGGSIRQPAAFCGVVGLKPTYGRVSRYGLVAFASSLDQVGPLATTAEDAALLLSVIAGHDPADSTSAPAAVPDYHAQLARPLAGLRLGLVRDQLAEGIDAEVAAAVLEAVRVFQSLGAVVRDVSLPHSRYGIATYYIIAPSEASSNLARYDGVHYGYRADERAVLEELERERRELAAAGRAERADDLDSPLVRLYRRTRAEGFGAEVKRRVMLGTYALSTGYYDAYYLKALKVRRLIRGDYDRALADVDLIVGPVTPTVAFRRYEKQDDPLAMYLMDLYTVTANLAGIPAVSIPCGQARSGLPIGLQLQGAPFDEARLLQAAHQFQRQTDWHRRKPAL